MPLCLTPATDFRVLLPKEAEVPGCLRSPETEDFDFGGRERKCGWKLENQTQSGTRLCGRGLEC